MKKAKLKKEQILPIRKELDWLNQQFDLLTEEIRVERTIGLPTEEELAKQQLKAQKELAIVQKKMDKAKAHIKRRKQEIKQWKESFDRLDQDERVERMNELQREIKWRSEDIAAKEALIAELYFTKTNANGLIESLQVKEVVLKEGYYLRDIREDPRLKAIKEERDSLRSKLLQYQTKKV